MPRKYERSTDLRGRRYGLLTIISKTFRDKRLTPSDWYRVVCRCDCGKYVNVRLANLKAGRIKSCGCFQKEYMSQRMRKRGTVIDPKIAENFDAVYRYFIDKATNGLPDFGIFCRDMNNIFQGKDYEQAE